LAYSFTHVLNFHHKAQSAQRTQGLLKSGMKPN
jgi:hypothetical protein